MALIVRLRFHAGFVLGDDAEEFQLIRSLVVDGPRFDDHLRYRVPIWGFNYVAERLFGNYEASFFLPTWILSSLLPVLGCLTLRAAGYGLAAAIAGGAFIAFSPFEVLLGSLRANDVFLEFFLACAFWIFVRREQAPRLQGTGIAVALWAAFYAKLWSLFVVPVVTIYYLLQWRRSGERRGMVAFVSASLLFHAAACVFWRIETGTWMPFLRYLSATYPVPADQLKSVFLEYPRLVFIGSELGNRLFGAVPYILLGALAIKVAGSMVPALRRRAPRLALDRHDKWLAWSCLVFFILLNFFPNNFTFDRYYSVPRIFRYLAPLSYGMSLLTAKLLVDLGSLLPVRAGVRPAAAAGVLAIVAAGVTDAEAPMRAHRARLASIRAELRANCPPMVVIEGWQGIFFREVHLPEVCPETVVRSPASIYDARDHERWLRQIQPTLSNGTVLVTDFIQFVYYASHTDGFRLRRFDAPLDTRWTLWRQLDPIPFDRTAEPARLWRWHGTRGTDSPALPVPALPAAQLFDHGIERFDAGDYPETRAWMLAIVERFPGHELADDGAYFAAVTEWREQNPQETIRAFRALIERFPDSSWAAAACYHIGLSHRMMGREDEARQAFEAAVRRAAPGAVEGAYASTALRAMHGRAPLAAIGRGLTERVYAFQSWADAPWRAPSISRGAH